VLWQAVRPAAEASATVKAINRILICVAPFGAIAAATRANHNGAVIARMNKSAARSLMAAHLKKASPC